MKRFAFVVVLALAVAAPVAFAQDHGEVGVFADYFRLHNAGDANFVGIGGRAAFNVHKHIQFEAEMWYDFERTVVRGTVINGSFTGTTFRSPLRMINATFGPKIHTSGPVRLFAFAKGGFLNFSSSSGAATFGGFTNLLENVPDGNTNGVFYPGGGVEGFIGPVGLRVDVGDFMYFDNGANHNWRVTFGPQIRF
jgi:hypothetical protein